MISLDAIDRRILDRLQKNGRLSNAELAEQVAATGYQTSSKRLKLIETRQAHHPQIVADFPRLPHDHAEVQQSREADPAQIDVSRRCRRARASFDFGFGH